MIIKDKAPISVILKKTTIQVTKAPSQGDTTNSQFNIEISTKEVSTPCKEIDIYIPYGTSKNYLTDDASFTSVVTKGKKALKSSGWECFKQYPAENGYIKVSFKGGYGRNPSSVITSKNPFNLFFSKIAVLDNSGSSQRIVTLHYDLHQQNSPDITTLPQLTLTIETKATTPFVGYFTSTNFNPGINQPFELQWQIYNNLGKTMKLQASSLGASKENAPIKEMDSNATVITPPCIIPIKDAKGSKKITLTESTIFTLLGDYGDDPDKATAQLTISLNTLSVERFVAEKQIDGKWTQIDSNAAAVPIGTPIKFSYKVTYSTIADHNTLYLLTQEYYGNKEIMPLLPHNPTPPETALPATTSKKISVNGKTIIEGEFTVYPTRKTAYRIYINETSAPSSIMNTIIVNTSPDGYPIGAILMYPNNTIPSDWLLCDGASIDKPTEQPNLAYFNKLQIALGYSADHSGPIVLPDLKDRFVVGFGTDTKTVGLKGKGSPDSHQHHYPKSKPYSLKTKEAGTHRHKVGNRFYSQIYSTTDSKTDNINIIHTSEEPDSTVFTGEGGNHSHRLNMKFDSDKTLAPTQPYQNRPPYFSLNYIIKVKK